MSGVSKTFSHLTFVVVSPFLIINPGGIIYRDARHGGVVYLPSGSREKSDLGDLQFPPCIIESDGVAEFDGVAVISQWGVGGRRRCRRIVCVCWEMGEAKTHYGLVNY